MHCSHTPSSPARPIVGHGLHSFQTVLSPRRAPPGAPCVVSQEVALICPSQLHLHHRSICPAPTFLCPSLVQPVLPVEFNSFSQHLPRACPSLEPSTAGHRDDAGQGSAL